MRGMSYIVKHDEDLGWIQHRADNEKKWRDVKRQQFNEPINVCSDAEDDEAVINVCDTDEEAAKEERNLQHWLKQLHDERVARHGPPPAGPPPPVVRRRRRIK